MRPWGSLRPANFIFLKKGPVSSSCGLPKKTNSDFKNNQTFLIFSSQNLQTFHLRTCWKKKKIKKSIHIGEILPIRDGILLKVASTKYCSKWRSRRLTRSRTRRRLAYRSRAQSLPRKSKKAEESKKRQSRTADCGRGVREDGARDEHESRRFNHRSKDGGGGDCLDQRRRSLAGRSPPWEAAQSLL